MPVEPPPSRYRVIERGGRLVVIDSVAGRAPPTARDLLSEVAAGSPAERLESFFREADDSNVGTPPPPRPASAQAMIAAPPGLFRNVASTVCRDRRDGDGRLQWTTARWFDAKGPRTIAMSLASERQLGVATLTLLIVAVGEIIFLVGYLMIGFALVMITAEMLRRAKPAATIWIDRLASG